MDNGTYVQEDSIALKITGLSEDGINDIAADLCCFLNQEAVIVEKQKSTYHIVFDEIKFDKE